MNTRKKKKRPDKYHANLKIAIAQEYLTTELGYSSLSKKYSIPASTIKDFITWYTEKYTSGMEQAAAESSEVINNEQQRDGDLRVIALQMLIENASKELGVDIVKKFGTKQPKK